MLIAYGLRISEALELTLKDVAFEVGTVPVLRSDKREGTGSTKGDRFRSWTSADVMDRAAGWYKRKVQLIISKEMAQ